MASGESVEETTATMLRIAHVCGSATVGVDILAVEGVADGLVTITVALGVGLAIAAGVTFGEFVTRPRQARDRIGPGEHTAEDDDS